MSAESYVMALERVGLTETVPILPTLGGLL